VTKATAFTPRGCAKSKGMNPPPHSQGVRGRGAAGNPANPFEALHIEEDGDWLDEMARDPEAVPPSPKTQLFHDDTRTLITKNTSPDLSFEASLNPYRGCEHGCAYCYARRYHEFLGWSSGLDFETRLLVKLKAPALLRAELSSLRWVPKKLSCSGVTDCYQPVERRLQITRGCLEVLAEFRQPVVLITKNHLITRDIDYLSELARWQAGAALISITTLDARLAAALEPRASSPRMRLAAIRALTDAGIPTGVSVAPIIPGLNDHEITDILAAARAAGAQFAAYSLVRLPGSVAEVFSAWLQRHVSAEAAEKVLRRIREIHGGRLNDLRPGVRMRGEGQLAAQIGRLFKITARRLGFNSMRPEITAANFRRIEPGQGELF
jgi:DNA repair photolyase